MAGTHKTDYVGLAGIPRQTTNCPPGAPRLRSGTAVKFSNSCCRRNCVTAVRQREPISSRSPVSSALGAGSWQGPSKHKCHCDEHTCKSPGISPLTAALDYGREMEVDSQTQTPGRAPGRCGVGATAQHCGGQDSCGVCTRACRRRPS